jgi:hypothetical protein
MLYAAMFDHVSLPAKLPFEKEEVGDLPKSSSSQKNENGELLALSIRAIKQSPAVVRYPKVPKYVYHVFQTKTIKG